MPVDTSVYGNVQQPNMLATMGSMAQTGNAMNQNRLFQQEFNARKAIGPIYQQSIDPTTGQLDTNKLLSLAAKDPNVAFKAGDLAQQALERQGAQTNIQSTELDMAIKRQGQVRQAMSALAANPNAGPQDVIKTAGQLVANGVLTPQQAAGSLSTMPQDPQQLKGWLQQNLIQSMNGEQQLQALYGTPQVVNTGGQTNVLAVSPMTGARSLGSIQNTMAPGDAASPVQAFDPRTGQPVAITKAQFARAAGGAGMGGGGSAGAGMPGPNGGGMPAAPAQPQMGIPTGPALGAEAAANVSGQNSAQQGVDLQKIADTVPQRKAALQNLEADLQSFTSGPGADWQKVAKSAINRNNPFGNVFDPKSIASQEQFAKQATQLAQSQFQALGGTGTDAKLDSAVSTSPNEFLSQMGNKGIISLLKGNEDAIAVKNREWQNWLAQGNGPQSYGQFSTQFNKSFDPRVFQSTYMTPSDRAAMAKSMSPTELQQFKSSYNSAVEHGWIADPRTANGQ